jgi:amino acid adenylation domain-containing protein
MIRFTDRITEQLNHGGEQIACCINDVNHSYRQFSSNVAGIQNRMQRTGGEHIGILTQNHPSTYATIIAAWLTGKAYVPINATYPESRIESILADSGITDIFYSATDTGTENLKQSFPHIHFHCTEDLNGQRCFNIGAPADRTAYILFTSGTTGKPKGVPITFGNIQAFLDGFENMGYELGPKDRFLQMFELTFDLSVVCFAAPLMLGAGFYTLPDGMIKTLALYHVLDEQQITFSLMVPSAIQLLLPYLDDIELPQLRYSQFCGEALKLDLVKKWAKCIPNARIDNVYGPTEATIYCTYLTVQTRKIESQHHNGIMGIGKPMSKTKVLVNAEPNGELGELCLSGEQVTPGYLQNEEQNSLFFFELEGDRYYRTGDLVFRNESGNLFYAGRTDDQVKIQGYRVELSEIEVAAARILPQYQSVAVGFQHADQGWQLALFIQNFQADGDELRNKLSKLLPDYMVPHHVLSVEEMPLNSNGKTDKKMLRQLALRAAEE